MSNAYVSAAGIRSQCLPRLMSNAYMSAAYIRSQCLPGLMSNVRMSVCLLQISEVMAAAEQLMQGQLAGPTIAFLDEMPADLWNRLSTRLSNSTASAAQVKSPAYAIHFSIVYIVVRIIL